MLHHYFVKYNCVTVTINIKNDTHSVLIPRKKGNNYFDKINLIRNPRFRTSK